MKATLPIKAALLFSMAVATCAAAQQPARSGGPARWRLYGDWSVKVEFGERQMNAIVSFSRGEEGNLAAQWISPFGVIDLKEVTLDENELSFVQVVRFGENEFTSHFKGTIEDGKLTGTLSSDRGESKVEGQRSPRIPRAVGSWEMKFKVGDRDVTTTFVVKPSQDDELTAEWQSQWGEHEVADVAYERGNLTFKRKSKFQDRQWESTFEGEIRGDALSGVMKSEMGEIPVEGQRINAALIGTWNLDVSADWGQIKQRLVVYPNLTALYGTIPVKKVNFQDDRVDFPMVVEWDDQSFEMKFEGKLENSKLTGEITTSRGNQKITGTKVVRPSRRSRNM
ncbi:MAG: hypothetical protein JW741_14270 [Sedimentisphaerales bacterium]|nr:hypothetical protein [Sedimentisphaerales bacterium]